MEVNKARNMLEHEREIFSRPPRTWIQQTHKSQPGKRPSSERPSSEAPQKNKKMKHSQKNAATEEDVRRILARFSAYLHNQHTV